MDKEKILKLLNEIKENSHKNVIVYALDGCPACDELKQKLSNVGVVYETITMNGNEDMWKELEDRGGSEFAPQVEVEGYLIKEEEYETVNELISKGISLLIGKKVILK